MIIPTHLPPCLEIDDGRSVVTMTATVTEWRAAKQRNTIVSEEDRYSIDRMLEIADDLRTEPDDILVEKVNTFIGKVNAIVRQEKNLR